MNRMALLLPLLFLLLLIPWVRRLQSRASLEAGGWEGSLLIAACLWGATLTVVLEGLGRLTAIRQGPLALVWLSLVGILAAGLAATTRWRELRRPAWPRLGGSEWMVAGLLGILLLGLLVVAWISPPNNSDSLLYHMARVVHWAQNESLRHYGTAYGHQLWNPPWAEMAILNARVLWGDDRPANLIQWSAYLGVLIGVSGLGRLLGLGRGGRLLAVAFAASLPMAVLQATSTQNDLVTSLWLVAAAYLVLLSRRQPRGRVELAALGVALGLGLLTKGTFYVYGLVVALWLVIATPWRKAPAAALGRWLALSGIVVVLNLGHWSRNLTGWGSPLGPTEWIDGHATVTLNSLKPRLAVYPPRLVRALAPHLATPWPAVNTAIETGVKDFYRAFGVEVNASLVVWAWNDEDFAGNPLHLLLLLVSGVALAVSAQSRRGPAAGLGLVVVAAYLLMVLLLPAAITITGPRLQIPLFILWSAVFASVATKVIPDSVRPLAATVLVAAALPLMLFNSTRPVIGMRPEPNRWSIPCSRAFQCTAVGSVLVEPAERILLARVPQYQDGLTRVSRALAGSSCRQIGLRIDSSDPEYAIWWLLGAPQSGFRLETIYTTPSLEPLLDRSYRPCAIVCTICGDRTRLHGLPLALEADQARLFLGDGFTWDEDG